MASDLVVVDCGSLGTSGSQQVWHECHPPPISFKGLLVEDDYSDLEALQVLKVEGKDKASRTILRIVGKHFPGKSNAVFSFGIHFKFSGYLNKYLFFNV